MRQPPRSTWSCAIAAVMGMMYSQHLLGGQEKLGAIVWGCSRHSDVIRQQEGTCPKDGLVLEPVRIDTEWTCPVHTAISETEPGVCVIDKKSLVEVTVTRYWTCPQSVIHEIAPGNCADGELRQEVKQRHPEIPPTH